MPKLERPDLSLHYDVTGKRATPFATGRFSCRNHASWTPLVPLLAGHFFLYRTRQTARPAKTTPMGCALSRSSTWRMMPSALMDQLGP